MGKAKKFLGLGLVCASFFFLFNPSISVIDFLPDVFGYLLMCLGVSQLADLNYHFEEAKKNFRKMLIVSAVQLGSILLLFGMVTGRDRPTALLLVSFLVATAELVFLTKAYNEFFEGFFLIFLLIFFK